MCICNVARWWFRRFMTKSSSAFIVGRWSWPLSGSSSNIVVCIYYRSEVWNRSPTVCFLCMYCTAKQRHTSEVVQVRPSSRLYVRTEYYHANARLHSEAFMHERSIIPPAPFFRFAGRRLLGLSNFKCRYNSKLYLLLQYTVQYVFISYRSL